VPVVDASVFVNAFAVDGLTGDAARAELDAVAWPDVPAVLGAEVASALRRLVLLGQLDPFRALRALERVRAAPTNQFPFEPFARRIWQLRDNVSVYDAWYVALAEWLETDLITADARLANAPGPRCLIRLVG
jgi:predicted nucleic acid-binding protein